MCERRLLTRMRHGKIADGCPLSGEERSCSGHHRHDRVWPKASSARQFCCDAQSALWNLTVHGRGPRARSVVLFGITTVGAAAKKQGDERAIPGLTHKSP